MTSDIDSLLLRFYHPALKTIDPGLERVERFLKLIGSPQDRLPPVIHVAGTNGKGSLIAYLQAIFEAAGYSVHRYTSPHLVSFNERIVLNGKLVEDDYLRDLLARVERHIDDQPVTFFEATTAAAFLAFAEHPADVLLLETGMGGRLDATNMVAKPILTAITPVSSDHCSFLGDTVSAIAGEKAGIIKHGVACVTGRQQTEAANVIAEQAEALDAPLYRFDREWQLLWENGQAIYQSPERNMSINPALAGRHQYDNAATAVACIDRLPQFSITDSHIKQGLQNAEWPGRLQHMVKGRLPRLLPPGIELWLDGGHNPQGAEVLAQWLEDRDIKETYVICGMVKGKDTGA
jgi:dihydrofolate synthase/folylpolyglutamate synthase